MIASDLRPKGRSAAMKRRQTCGDIASAPTPIFRTDDRSQDCPAIRPSAAARATSDMPKLVMVLCVTRNRSSADSHSAGDCTKALVGRWTLVGRLGLTRPRPMTWSKGDQDRKVAACLGSGSVGHQRLIRARPLRVTRLGVAVVPEL